LSDRVARYVARDGLWNGSSIRVVAGTLVVEVVATVLDVDVDVDVEVDGDVVVVSPTIEVDERGCWAL
jgi:hypothetical protein